MTKSDRREGKTQTRVTLKQGNLGIQHPGAGGGRVRPSPGLYAEFLLYGLNGLFEKTAVFGKCSGVIRYIPRRSSQFIYGSGNQPGSDGQAAYAPCLLCISRRSPRRILHPRRLCSIFRKTLFPVRQAAYNLLKISQSGRGIGTLSRNPQTFTFDSPETQKSYHASGIGRTCSRTHTHGYSCRFCRGRPDHGRPDMQSGRVVERPLDTFFQIFA